MQQSRGHVVKLGSKLTHVSPSQGEKVFYCKYQYFNSGGGEWRKVKDKICRREWVVKSVYEG